MENIIATRHEIITPCDPLKAWVYLHSENRIIAVKEHWHRSLELTLVIDGEYTYHIGGVERAYGKNDLLIVNCEEIHSCRATSLKNLEAVSLNVPFDVLHDSFPEIQSRHFSLDNNEKKSDEIKQEMWNIYAYFKQRKEIPFFENMINSYIYKILYLLLRYCSYPVSPAYLSKESRNSEKLKKIITFLLENYSTETTQEAIADDFGMTRENLSRLFKKQTGITFREFLNSVRIRHAFFDLLNTDDSITDIALNNGFPDSRGFIRQFKKKYGQLPADFRKNNNLPYGEFRDTDGYYF